MNRRAALPKADELFRTTSADRPGPVPVPAPVPASVPAPGAALRAVPPASGRRRHEEKITVYLSPQELGDLERARLALREQHGVRVDRGRIVREAVAAALADLATAGESAVLVRRLREQRG